MNQPNISEHALDVQRSVTALDAAVRRLQPKLAVWMSPMGAATEAGSPNGPTATRANIDDTLKEMATLKTALEAFLDTLP